METLRVTLGPRAHRGKYKIDRKISTYLMIYCGDSSENRHHNTLPKRHARCSNESIVGPCGCVLTGWSSRLLVLQSRINSLSCLVDSEVVSYNSLDFAISTINLPTVSFRKLSCINRFSFHFAAPSSSSFIVFGCM